MIKAVILGVIQGLTEFLPVSSSGHLVIAEKFLGMHSQSIVLEVFLHMGTLLAVIVYFYRDILRIRKDWEYLKSIGIVVLITGVLGVLGKGFFSSLFQNPSGVMLALMINGLVLLTTRHKNGTEKSISAPQAVLIGLAQALAIAPGISRSGSTIAAMLHLKIDREEAFRFSFIMSIPLILGAFLLELKDITSYTELALPEVAVGVVCAFVSGLIALKLLKAFLVQQKFYLFGYYCLAVGAVLLGFNQLFQ